MHVSRQVGRAPRALSALALLVALSSCAPEEYRIGAILPSSSDTLGSYSTAIRNGMELALEEFNAAGGIDGKELTVLYRDSKGNPALGRAAAEELYSQLGVPAIIGAVGSDVTLEIAPLACEMHRILLSPASSNPKLSEQCHYVFRNYPSDVLEGAVMAEFAAEDLKLRTIVVVAARDQYGVGLKSVFNKRYQRRNREVLKVINYDPGKSDMAAIVGEIKDLQPEGIYFAGYVDDVVELLAQVKEQRVDTQILTVNAFAAADVLERAGESAEGVIFAQFAFDVYSEDLLVRDFVSKYKDKYGVEPDIFAAHGYDALTIMANSMAIAHNNPDDIQIELVNVDYRGVAGTTRFDSNGDVIKYPRIYIVDQGRFIQYSDHRKGSKS